MFEKVPVKCLKQIKSVTNYECNAKAFFFLPRTEELGVHLFFSYMAVSMNYFFMVLMGQILEVIKTTL